MSPILTRPVREQFEHDRVIRVLQTRYRRKFDVVINPGAEQNASVGAGELTMVPDVVLFSQERGRRLQGTVEVETGESVNTLEAMAEWGPFSRLRAPFYLYVPPNSVDTARRLCAEHHVTVAEIWTYHTAIDQVRFTMVHRSPDVPTPRPRPAAAPKAEVRPAARVTPTEPAKPQRTAARTPAPKASARSTRKATAKAAPTRRPARAKSAKAAKKTAAKKTTRAAKRR